MQRKLCSMMGEEGLVSVMDLRSLSLGINVEREFAEAQLIRARSETD